MKMIESQIMCAYYRGLIGERSWKILNLQEEYGCNWAAYQPGTMRD